MSDVAALVLAAAVAIFAVSVGLLVWRKGFASVEARMGSMHLTLKAVEERAKTIDLAVNNVPKGTPPLVDRMTVMERRSVWTVEAIKAVAAVVGAELPEEEA